jgi:hypothetical protein
MPLVAIQRPTGAHAILLRYGQWLKAKTKEILHFAFYILHF